MLKGHDFRAVHVILLAVAINALAVTFWLALAGIMPGFVLPHDIAAGTDWIEVFGYLILWLASFALVGVLVAARMLFMRWVLGAPASGDPPEAGSVRPQARNGA